MSDKQQAYVKGGDTSDIELCEGKRTNRAETEAAQEHRLQGSMCSICHDCSTWRS